MAALRKLLIAVGALAVLVMLAGGVLALRLREHGISARDEPMAIEAFVARAARSWAMPVRQRDARNPVEATPEALGRARAHFADHCASCHGNDGRGRTKLGQGLKVGDRVVIVVVEDKDKAQNVEQVLLGTAPAADHKH
jgi:mono/diheme cytochrome c family protein